MHCHECREMDDLMTPKQWKVLQALGKGMDNKQIAYELNMGVKTVKNHLSHVFLILGVRSRLQAVVFAYRHQLIKVE